MHSGYWHRTNSPQVGHAGFKCAGVCLYGGNLKVGEGWSPKLGLESYMVGILHHKIYKTTLSLEYVSHTNPGMLRARTKKTIGRRRLAGSDGPWGRLTNCLVSSGGRNTRAQYETAKDKCMARFNVCLEACAFTQRGGPTNRGMGLKCPHCWMGMDIAGWAWKWVPNVVSWPTTCGESLHSPAKRLPVLSRVHCGWRYWRRTAWISFLVND